MTGAKSVEPPVIRQRLAEPLRSLVNRRALRYKDPLQVRARNSIVFIVSIHQSVARPSCVQARRFASFAEYLKMSLRDKA